MPNIVTYNYTNTLGRNMIKPGYTTVGIGITGPYQPNYSQTFLNSTWRNGFDTSSGTVWVLYSNDFSQGVQGTQANGLPVGWTTNGSNTSLLELINVIPERSQQTPFGDLDSAVAWAIADGNYLIQNREYPAIGFENNLMLAGYDPATTICYPRVGDDLYDITGRESRAATKTLAGIEQDSTPFKFDFGAAAGDISIPTGLASIIASEDNQAFTFSAFVYIYEIGSEQTIIQIGGSTALGTDDFIRFYVNGSGELTAEGCLNENTINDQFSNIPMGWFPNINTWYHLAIVVNQAASKFVSEVYVNGTSVSTPQLKSGVSPANFVSGGTQTQSHIGSLKNSSSRFNGQMGPVHIYSGILSITDITYLKNTINDAYGYGI